MRLAPRPFESFCSWFLAYCRLLEAAPVDLAEHVGMSKEVLARPLLAVDSGGLADPYLATLAEAASLNPEAIESTWMPLRRNDELVRTHSPGFHRSMVASHMSYCPNCLAQSHGRWDNRWRLPWRQVCLVHQVWLVPRCWRCTGLQFHRQLPGNLVGDHGWSCHEPAPGASGRTARRCGADLREAATVPVRPGATAAVEELDVLLRAGSDLDPEQVERFQVLVATARYLARADPAAASSKTGAGLTAALCRGHELLSDDRAFQVFARMGLEGRPAPVPKRLKDAPAILEKRFTRARKTDLHPLDSLRWSVATESRRPWRTAEEAAARCALRPEALWADWTIRIAGSLPAVPATTRAAAAIALTCIGTDAPVTAVEELESRRLKLKNFLALIRSADHVRITAALVQLSEALDRHGSPIDYTRRAELFGNELPPLTSSRWKEVAARGGVAAGKSVKLNAARRWLWEELTGRDPTTMGFGSFGSSDAYHRFLVGLTPETVSELMAYAAELLDQQGVIGEPVSWSPPARWVDADLIDIEPTHTDKAEVLAALVAGEPTTRVAASLGVPPAVVAWTVRTCPPALRPRANGPPRVRPLPGHVTATWVATQIGAGTSVKALARTTGVPRTRLAALLAASASTEDPFVTRKRGTSTDDLRALYVDQQLSVESVAAAVNLSAATVRNRLRLAHLLRPAQPRPAQQLPTGVTPQWVASQVSMGSSIGSVARDLSVPRRTVRSALETIGAVPSGGRRMAGLSPAWLREQYVDNCRTLGDIAAEAGVSSATVGNHLARAGIDRRTSTGATALHELPPQDRPEPLRGALFGPKGLLRVQRFQVIAASPNLETACEVIGVAQKALVKQLEATETAAGGRLITRASKDGGRFAATPLGSALADQAARFLGANPLAPPPTPSPLSEALGVHLSERRVTLFVETTEHGSLVAAATDFGRGKWNLRESLLAFERATGLTLFTGDLHPDRPIVLTSTGERLREQAQARRCVAPPPSG